MIKSLKEKYRKREQLAKENGEKDIGGSSTITNTRVRVTLKTKLFRKRRNHLLGNLSCWPRHHHHTYFLCMQGKGYKSHGSNSRR